VHSQVRDLRRFALESQHLKADKVSAKYKFLNVLQGLNGDNPFTSNVRFGALEGKKGA
jgi:hypothetical protein